MRQPIRWTLTFAFAALVAASCGGVMQFQNKACERRYEDCTDACADRCEAGRPPIDDSRRPPTIDDHELGYERCTDCVSECRKRAEQCEAESVPQ